MTRQKVKESSSKKAIDMVPASWKLCALVLRAIAEGRLPEFEEQVLPICEDDILNGSIEYETFSDAVHGLYIEACKDTRRELPTEILSVDKPQEALVELRTAAQEIIAWYERALPFIDKTSNYAKDFETIANNCSITIGLLTEKSDGDNEGHDSELPPSFFSHAQMRFWHKLVNGKCIEEMDYDDFYNILECRSKHEPLQIRPLAGYGMAMYAFLLLLVINRRMVIDKLPNYEVDDYGEIYVSGIYIGNNYEWEGKFKERIAWDDSFNVREDSWKTGYFSTDERPTSYTSDVSQEDKDRINTLCKRQSFEDVVGPDALERIVTEQVPFILGFEQYKYIHDNLDSIEDVYSILVQELEYLYENFDNIVDCFEDKHRAERNHDEYSKLRYELKQNCNETINKIYVNSLIDSNYSTIHRILFSRRFYGFEYLWQCPLMVYSELIDQYLQKCIIQDEQLLLVIKRALEDTTLKQSIDKEKARASKKELRKFNAKIALGSLIDDNSNIVKQSDRIEVVRRLMQKQEGDKNEFARPKGGWSTFIEQIKHDTIPVKYEVNGEWVPLIDNNNRFTRYFYDNIGVFARVFLNGINWSFYDNVFKLDGEKLKGEKLKSFIGSRRALYVDLIKDIIKKYEEKSKNPFVKISK